MSKFSVVQICVLTTYSYTPPLFVIRVRALGTSSYLTVLLSNFAVPLTDALASTAVELNVTIPIGSKGTVRIPLVAAAGHVGASVTVKEGGVTVWADGAYVAGVKGISAAKLDRGPGLEGEGVVFTVLSGTYAFALI